MKNERKIPWFSIISFLFGGIGITICQKIIDIVKENLDLEVLVEFLNQNREGIVTLLTGIIIAIVLILNFHHYYKSYKSKTEIHIKEIENILDNTQGELECTLDDLAHEQYLNEKYAELDGFYRKVSSIISVKGTVSDSIIMNYLDKIKDIVFENISVKESNINVTLFQRTSKNAYKIRLSNYHTEGTVKNLVCGKKSFVADVYNSKKVKYIPDLDAIGREEKFIEKDGRTYHTILGIPYVVDDKSVFVAIITMNEANSLDNVYSRCLVLLERYVQAIGILVVLQNMMEDK